MYFCTRIFSSQTVYTAEGQVTGQPPTVPCVPDCTGQPDGKALPDITDTTCRSYFLCFMEQANGPEYCEVGEVFNGEATNYPPCKEGEACTPDPVCPDYSSGSCSFTCASPVTTTPGPAPLGHTSGISRATKKMADHYDCSVYYECNREQPGDPETCPESTPFFDGSECQNNASVCCSCKPYCPRPFITGETFYYVPDMADCTKAYVCLEPYVVPEIDVDCSPQNFDVIISDCSSTAPCITFCTNVVGSNGCIDIYTCPSYGYFAKCPQLCSQEYYYCDNAHIDNIVSPTTCADGKYFNPNSQNCVAGPDCPYPLVTPPPAQETFSTPVTFI